MTETAALASGVQPVARDDSSMDTAEVDPCCRRGLRWYVGVVYDRPLLECVYILVCVCVLLLFFGVPVSPLACIWSFLQFAINTTVEI